MTDVIKVPVYLQVEGRDPDFNPQTLRWDGLPRAGSVTNATKSRPTRVARGAVVVKVELRIPASVFATFLPRVVVDVPESLVDVPAEAEAQDATDGAR